MPRAKNKTIVVDSSVIISSLIESDPFHKFSRNFLSELKRKKQQIILPMLAVFEILHAYFRLCKNQEKTDELYQALIDWNLTGFLRIANLEASFLVYFTANHHLFPIKTADCVIALTAHRLQSPLISWDKQLLKNAKKYLIAITPEKFLRNFR